MLRPQISYAESGKMKLSEIDRQTRKPGEYVYHASYLPDLKHGLSSILKYGLKPSVSGYAGPGVYFAYDPSGGFYHVDKSDATIFRVKWSDLVKLFGTYPINKNGIQRDNDEIVVPGRVPADIIEVEYFPDEWWDIKTALAAERGPIDEAESHTPASKEIRTSLRRAGYKLLGHGVDATVWTKNDREILKIIMPSEAGGAGQSGEMFKKFYEFCKQNENIPYLPKFTDEVKAFVADGKEYVMIAMEKLTPIPSNSLEEALVWALSDCAVKRRTWDQTKQYISSHETWSDYGGKLDSSYILDKIDNWSRKEQLQYEVIYKLMVLLYHTGRINKFSWDLHTENAMMRGNTIVITDPWITT